MSGDRLMAREVKTGNEFFKKILVRITAERTAHNKRLQYKRNK